MNTRSSPRERVVTAQMITPPKSKSKSKSKQRMHLQHQHQHQPHHMQIQMQELQSQSQSQSQSQQSSGNEESMSMSHFQQSNTSISTTIDTRSPTSIIQSNTRSSKPILRNSRTVLFDSSNTSSNGNSNGHGSGSGSGSGSSWALPSNGRDIPQSQSSKHKHKQKHSSQRRIQRSKSSPSTSSSSSNSNSSSRSSLRSRSLMDVHHPVIVSPPSSKSKSSTTSSNSSPWRSSGIAERRKLLSEDDANGGCDFTIHHNCPLRNYCGIANRVQDQFQSAYRSAAASPSNFNSNSSHTNTGTSSLSSSVSVSVSDLRSTYIMGHRLLKFLSVVLPTHRHYHSSRPECTRLRIQISTNEQNVRRQVDHVAFLLDREIYLIDGRVDGAGAGGGDGSGNGNGGDVNSRSREEERSFEEEEMEYKNYTIPQVEVEAQEIQSSYFPSSPTSNSRIRRPRTRTRVVRFSEEVIEYTAAVASSTFDPYYSHSNSNSYGSASGNKYTSTTRKLFKDEDKVQEEVEGVDVDVDVDVDESSSIDMERQESELEKGLKKMNNVKGRRNQKGKNVGSTTDGKTEGDSNDGTSASAKAKAAKMKKKKKSVKRSTIRGSGGDSDAVENVDVDTKDENEVSATVSNKVSPSPKKKKKERTDTNVMKKRKPTTSSISSAATMAAAAAAAANSNKFLKENIPKPFISGVGFNVVLTHCTADFDTLASAVGLAKLWSNAHPSLMGSNVESNATGNNGEGTTSDSTDTDGEGAESSSISTGFISSSMLPTFVVLPRGAHPAVQKFLALHKHLFPIRSLRSLPSDLSGLNRLGLVDAQRRDRVGPAEHLISYADRVTIIDHHIEGDSDIPEATDYVVDEVGSVSAMIAEQLKEAGFELSEAEATLLALGIHADTGSLCYDSTTVRDAQALAWVMAQGASQAAIAEHAHSTLSQEQQGVLTNALINTNSTIVHGVTVSTVLLSADGFINGLAAVTQDALELSSSDVYLLAVVYEPKSGSKKKKSGAKNSKDKKSDVRLYSKLLKSNEDNTARGKSTLMQAEAWKGGELALKMKRLRAAFDKKDTDRSGFLDSEEISVALVQSGVIVSEESLKKLVQEIDLDGNGKIDFDEFVTFSDKAAEMQKEQEMLTGRKATTMIVIGRVKAGVNMKDVNLNTLFQQFGGGGHAKAASCTIKLADESDAGDTLQGLVDELIETSLMQQSTVGDFMTSPVLSAKPAMNEKQVEDLFIRYDVRALPVVDDNNDVIGLVTYKEVAAAKQRLWNKEQKRIRQDEAAAKRNASGKDGKNKKQNEQRKINEQQRESRKLGSALKGWMKQHVQTVEAGRTMAEVEAVLLENDVGCIPVVADGTTQLVGLVTRTDLLRQHRYYPTLHYHNPGFADSIAARKPIIELRKKLKQFDMEEE